MVKQIRFEDLVGDVYGGLLVDNKYIICGHCGDIIEDFCPLDEDIENFRDKYNCKIIEIYDKWVPLSDEIIGN